MKRIPRSLFPPLGAALFLPLIAPSHAVEIPKPVINVPRPNIPRPTINVPRPHIPRPTVNIPRPNVTVNVPKPAVNVPRPTVHLPRPSVHVPKPNVAISVPKPTVHVPHPAVTTARPPTPPVAAASALPGSRTVIVEGNPGGSAKGGITPHGASPAIVEGKAIAPNTATSSVIDGKSKSGARATLMPTVASKAEGSATGGTSASGGKTPDAGNPSASPAVKGADSGLLDADTGGPINRQALRSQSVAAPSGRATASTGEAKSSSVNPNMPPATAAIVEGQNNNAPGPAPASSRTNGGTAIAPKMTSGATQPQATAKGASSVPPSTVTMNGNTPICNPAPCKAGEVYRAASGPYEGADVVVSGSGGVTPTSTTLSSNGISAVVTGGGSAQQTTTVTVNGQTYTVNGGGPTTLSGNINGQQVTEVRSNGTSTIAVGGTTIATCGYATCNVIAPNQAGPQKQPSIGLPDINPYAIGGGRYDYDSATYVARLGDVKSVTGSLLSNLPLDSISGNLDVFNAATSLASEISVDGKKIDLGSIGRLSSVAGGSFQIVNALGSNNSNMSKFVDVVEGGGSIASGLGRFYGTGTLSLAAEGTRTLNSYSEGNYWGTLEHGANVVARAAMGYVSLASGLGFDAGSNFSGDLITIGKAATGNGALGGYLYDLITPEFKVPDGPISKPINTIGVPQNNPASPVSNSSGIPYYLDANPPPSSISANPPPAPNPMQSLTNVDLRQPSASPITQLRKP